VKTIARRVCLPLLLLPLFACDLNKSENPLSPTVAGPIAGVDIGAPLPVEPVHGAKLNHTASSVTLVVQNASTTGQRPIAAYSYEVSRDAAMQNVIFSKSDVAPGGGGRTSIVVPGPFNPGATYYWRVKASDGANSSAFSDPISFVVLEPVVLGAPNLVAPTAGATVSSLQPALRVSNVSRSGPFGVITYDFEVSLSDTFANLAAYRSSGEQSSTTETTVGPLEAGRTYFWRVRARDGSVESPWSSSRTFLTPTAVVTPPPPSGGLPPSNPGPRPSVSEGTAMVAAVIADMRARGISMEGDCGAWEITRRVAWAFRNRGAGLEYKPGGRNCHENSIDIVLFTDGQSVDILFGSGVDNGPAWQEHGVLPDWAYWWRAPSNPD
jgi:hypothetical protein